MRDLFFGDGIAHSILLFAFVIAIGIYLSRFKLKGVSIGATWVLFIGLFVSHFGFVVNPKVLVFMKEFGLILFVFSIGLQVGPGFFQSFKKGGVLLNILAIFFVLMAFAMVFLLHFVSGEDLRTLTGVMSGAVTNTPGLGAAQQTLSDALKELSTAPGQISQASAQVASAYAVAYPMGVLGVILMLILFKHLFKVDFKKEKAELDANSSSLHTARRMHCMVDNPAIFGRKVADILEEMNGKLVITRILRNSQVIQCEDDTTFQKGDKVLLVTSQQQVDVLRIIFGKEVPMHLADWEQLDVKTVSRRLAITKSSLTGRTLKSLHVKESYGLIVTRILRSGVHLVADPNFILNMGDTLQVVGNEEGIEKLAKVLGNKPDKLSHPNLVPIFLGIVFGIIIGSIPLPIPGIPHSIKLGLAGGPLIVSIIIGYFGPKWRITTYTTLSANMMIREIGIAFFMAAVGLGAGQNFIHSIINGGYWWFIYGSLITLVPVSLTILVAHYIFKLNYYQICGLITGGTTNPPALAFAQHAYGSDYTSVNYATVYPISMFMRVLVAQLLILFSF